MAELYKILKDSPISEEVDSAAQKLDEIEKNKTCLLFLPVSCFRWKRKSSAKDVLAKFKDQFDNQEQSDSKLTGLDRYEMDEDGKVKCLVQ
jgi:hypothetical protein